MKAYYIKTFFITLALFIAHIGFVYAQQDRTAPIIFSYQYIDSNKYTINAENTQSIVENGKLLRKGAKLKNHISLEIKERASDNFFISQTTEFTDSGQLVYDEKSEFYQYSNGVTDVPEAYITPLVRSIPRFYTRSVKPFERWTAKGIDTVVVPGANLSAKIEVDVRYQYVGFQKLPQNQQSFNDDALPLIKAAYEIENYEITDKFGSSLWKAEGQFGLRMWWNHSYGRPEFYDETYNIVLTNMKTKRVIKFTGEAFGQVIPVEVLEREKNLQEIQKALGEELSDASAKSTDLGLTITLNDINFPPDSSVLLESEQKKLDAIARILQQHSSRRILVEGHTALAGTEETRKKLSVNRARSVSDYLQSLLGNDIKILFRGWGAQKPIAPNQTEESKQKNRRVEITILEN